MNWFRSMRDKDGNLVNQDPETGVRYGVISQNSLDEYALEDIFQNGEDLDYLEARAEMEKELRAKYFGKNAHLVERELERWSDYGYGSGDSPTYRYETEENGEKIVVQTSESYLWVFKGPVVKARLCSPCYPNAGNLDEIDEENGYETYGLPKDWLRKEDE